MDYEQKLSKVARELRGFAAKEIHMNYEDVRVWAEMEACDEFIQEYINVFRKHFGDKITPKIEDQILVAGSSIEYLLLALHESDTDVDDMVRITTSFISSQVLDMINWCDELSESCLAAETGVIYSPPT
jgi:hypothetical protein